MLAQSVTESALRRRAPEEKRALICAAARYLFAEFGFAATSTLQIAKRAGVSEGILFHHFGSKKGLFVCLLEDYARGAAEATMPSDATQLTEESIVRGAFDFADSNPMFYRLLIKAGAELIELQDTAQNELLVAVIEEKLKQGMAVGQIRQGDAAIMAQLQFAVVDAAYRSWHESQENNRREDYIQEAVACMKAMLAP